MKPSLFHPDGVSEGQSCPAKTQDPRDRFGVRRRTSSKAWQWGWQLSSYETYRSLAVTNRKAGKLHPLLQPGTYAIALCNRPTRVSPRHVFSSNTAIENCLNRCIFPYTDSLSLSFKTSPPSRVTMNSHMGWS